MGMERHEVPTVFVRGVAAPSDVGYADQRLQAVLLECPCAVRYAVLWIATDGVDGIEVEIEIGSADAPISARAVGTKLCDTADACLELLVDQLTATLV